MLQILLGLQMLRIRLGILREQKVKIFESCREGLFHQYTPTVVVDCTDLGAVVRCKNRELVLRVARRREQERGPHVVRLCLLVVLLP